MRDVQAIVGNVLEETERECAFIADIPFEIQDPERNVARHQEQLALLAETGSSFHFQKNFSAEQIDE